MQWFFEVEWTETVPPSAFRPEPEVESGWIKLIPRTGEWSFETVRQFTEICFQQPRKTLLNNLSLHGNNKSEWKTWFQDQGWNPRRRPHSLERNEFRQVFDAWQNRF
jgi:16S rRNA A1518/A1519 N6-dimethyltransferase RsmA/KsgA/DIM1 with predicted DNA glycosylase/AP lyase activity